MWRHQSTIRHILSPNKANAKGVTLTDAPRRGRFISAHNFTSPLVLTPAERNSEMTPQDLEGEQSHSFPPLLSGHRRMLQSNCRRRASSRAGVEPESSRSCALAADSRSVFEPTTRAACHGAAPFASNKSLPCVHAMSVPAFDRGRRPGRRLQGAGHAFGPCSLTYHGPCSLTTGEGAQGFPMELRLCVGARTS